MYATQADDRYAHVKGQSFKTMGMQFMKKTLPTIDDIQEYVEQDSPGRTLGRVTSAAAPPKIASTSSRARSRSPRRQAAAVPDIASALRSQGRRSDGAYSDGSPKSSPRSEKGTGALLCSQTVVLGGNVLDQDVDGKDDEDDLLAVLTQESGPFTKF